MSEKSRNNSNKQNAEGEDLVKVPREEWEEMKDTVETLRAFIGVSQMEQDHSDDQEVRERWKRDGPPNLFGGMRTNSKFIDEVSDKILELEKTDPDLEEVFGVSQVDQVAKTLVENFDEFKNQNGVVTTGGQGDKGIAAIYREHVQGGGDVDSRTMRRAMKKIADELDWFQLTTKNRGELVLMKI